MQDKEEIFLRKKADAKSVIDSFTKRQEDCIKFLLEGYSANEVGRLLNISRRTVEAHINKVKAKLRCNKIIQLGYLIGKFSEKI